MTAEEIIKKLEEDYDKSDFWNEDLDTEDFGEWEMVDEEGGYEGGGEYAHRVVHFKTHDVYIKLEGFYSSYAGTDYEDEEYQIVKPTQRMVTFYE